jgi:hypothetical protein
MNNDANITGPANDRSSSVRVGTIVWGFLLIGLAAWFFLVAQVDLSRFDPGIIAAWAVLGIGALALVGGLLGAVLRRR